MKKLSALSLLLLSFSTFSQELTLYIIPSPKGIDWSTPSSLVQSALVNKLTFKKRFIGHVFVELNCGKPNITGMTTKNFDYLEQLLVKGSGLGILYHSFEGRLEKDSEVSSELQEYIKNGDVSFVRFKLNQGQCQRATQYLTEYQEKNVEQNYGLANRPRHGEGAGCSAYGVSYLDVLGILDQEMKESWSQTINIPLKFAGEPLTDKYVNLGSFFLNDVQWARSDEDHVPLFFWNPDRMHLWVIDKTKKKHSYYRTLSLGKSQGVVFDKSLYPVPKGLIWRQK